MARPAPRAVSSSSVRRVTTVPWFRRPVSASVRVASMSWRCCRVRRACDPRKTRNRIAASSAPAKSVTSMMSRRDASRLASRRPASRQSPTTATGSPEPSRMGRYSWTMPSSFGSPPAASTVPPGPTRVGGGALPETAAPIAADSAPARPTAPGSSLAMTRPSSPRSSTRRIESAWSRAEPESLAVSVSSWSLRSASRADPGPPGARSLGPRVLLTKNAMSEASRLATVLRVEVDRCVEVMATSALAVTPTRTRTTPMTSASSTGRPRSRVIG